MLLAGKATWAGIVFLLLTSGISRPRRTPLAPEINVSKEVPAVAQRNDVKKIQAALQGNGQYGGKVDGVFGLRTRASIRGFQKEMCIRDSSFSVQDCSHLAFGESEQCRPAILVSVERSCRLRRVLLLSLSGSLS